MAVAKFIKERRGVFNQFKCSECKEDFVYEDTQEDDHMGDLIKINYCPLCGVKLDWIVD